MAIIIKKGLTKAQAFDIMNTEDKKGDVENMAKLFKIFQWYDENNGVGEGTTQTYLMAENRNEALEIFGKLVNDNSPWYCYGAKESDKEEFARQLDSISDELMKIQKLHDSLLITYESLEKRLDRS